MIIPSPHETSVSVRTLCSHFIAFHLTACKEAIVSDKRYVIVSTFLHPPISISLHEYVCKVIARVELIITRGEAEYICDSFTVIDLIMYRPKNMFLEE